jgi:hypothetical protein
MLASTNRSSRLAACHRFLSKYTLRLSRIKILSRTYRLALTLAEAGLIAKALAISSQPKYNRFMAFNSLVFIENT